MLDHLIWACGKTNIALHLRDREAGLGNSRTYRRNRRIWRTLVCDETSVYKKTWSVSSKTMIYYLGGRLYLDDFRTCYSLNGLNAMPALIYKNPDKSHSYKLEANLHCSADLPTLPLPNAGHRPYILALTKCQKLVRIDLQTGYICQRIFLGQQCNTCFKYLTWDVFQERAVVCSTQSKSPTGLKSFVLFNVFPFEVVGRLTVTQEVFGADICDANISDGLLIVMHRNDKVRMYSLEKILEENVRYQLRLGEAAATGCNTFTAASGVVGSHPTGIPTNIQLTDCPAIVLEVTCFNREVFIGGHPWHYMYIPHKKDPLITPGTDVGTETYLVANIATNKLIENGPLDMECESENPTMAFFHMDDSHRIIQLGDFEMIMNAFHTRDDGNSELRVAYRVIPPGLHNAEDDEKHNDASGWITTLSGRRVSAQWRKRLRVRNKIRDVNYDNELDFLLMSYVTTMAECHIDSPVADKGKLGIHCNQTGQLLKTVDLDGMGFEYRPTSLEMDMDFMIHIYVEDPCCKVVCSLYRLECPTEYVGHDKGKRAHCVKDMTTASTRQRSRRVR